MCVPPWIVLTPLAKPSRLSVYMSEFQRIATSTETPRTTLETATTVGSSKSGFFDSQMCETYSQMPPRWQKVSTVGSGSSPSPSPTWRSSITVMLSPALR